MSHSEGREESITLSVIRTWSALAWADGVLEQREAQALRRLIHGAELGEAERASALGFLEEPVALEVGQLKDLSAVDREGIYRAAVKLSAIDREVADEEIVLLHRMRDGLGLDQPTAERIANEVAAGR